ncbi:MAG: NUDIX domain-containing protein [Candidatus Saccharibacteria bacterium]|nr:NUDIX domain-containing protein [Candidatus Saccharibacteria bacterium]
MNIVVAALIKKDGQYLLAKRASGNKDLIGFWEFPGGKVKAGETDEMALEREILEEFNTVVKVGKLVAKSYINNDHELRLYACEHSLGPYKLNDHSEIVWKKDLDSFHSYNLAPADEELLNELTGLNKRPHLDELVRGATYDNAKLSHIFCVSSQGGMRKSNKSNSLVLIARHDESNPYDDNWKDGEFHYTGMGLSGDQDVDYKQNKTVKESRSNGVNMHLFESFDGNEYIYRGKVELCSDPYFETQKDEFGKPRKVIKFPLKLVD